MIVPPFLYNPLLFVGLLLLWVTPVPSLLSNPRDDHASFEPSLHRLYKRDIYADWSSVDPDGPYYVPLGEVKQWPITQGTTQWFATAQYYGCTVFAIIGKSYVSIGHMREVGPGGSCPLATPAGTTNTLIPKNLQPQTDLFAPFSDSCPADIAQRYAVIFGSVRGPPAVPGRAPTTGVDALKTWFQNEFDIPANNVLYQLYTPSGGNDGTPTPGPSGKFMVKWNSDPDTQGNPNGGTIQVLAADLNPRLQLVYNADGTLAGEPLVTEFSGIQG